MKTIKKQQDSIDSDFFDYKRVTDVVAEKLVRNEGWEYCPKLEWKTKIRDINKKETKNENS